MLRQAADEFALFIIGKGSIAEGVRVKDLATRIRVAYEALPQKAYKCPKGQVSCYALITKNIPLHTSSRDVCQCMAEAELHGKLVLAIIALDSTS